MNAKQSPSTRADELLKAMTLADKVNMLHGSGGSPVSTVGYIAPIPRLHVPGITMTDGPAGVRDNTDKSTELPSPSAEAASFDPKVAEDYGSVLGGDARALGQAQVFGPGQNIQRVPVNGRNFEYYSEDPYLSGTMSGADVRGIQSHGVIATLKHYVANNQENNRDRVSANMDDRTLHEIYEKNFGVAVADGTPGSVMCSYNKINDVYSCDNSDTLGSLRSQLRFTGFVVSDYPATHATTSIKDGLNVELPDGVYNTLPNVQAALKKGSITTADIDARVRETLTVLFKFGLFDRDPTARSPIDQGADNAAAQRIEAQGAVLLKNEDKALPLDSSTHKIAVIGDPAKNSAQGGGSSQVAPLSVDNAYDAIVSRAGSAATVAYADGSNLDQAAATAKSADTALVFVRDYESEGGDRSNLSLPNNQDALINAVAEANPHTVVVLQTGSAVLMPWLTKVKSVLQTWYPGARGGAATAQLLWGDVNPSGKLPQTWPKSDTQTPVSTTAQYPGVNLEGSYSEGVYVGYRWYDKHDETPLFPFGHGLSYTGFRYSDLQLQHSSGNSTDPVTASFKITNTGDRAGTEAPQLYVSKPDTLAPTPPKELGAFGKVQLAPHETKTVTLTVNPRELSYWDSGAQAFTVQDGSYPIAVGGSSASLPLHATYKVNKTDGPVRADVSGLSGLAKPGTTYTVTTKVSNLSDFTLTSGALKVTAPAGWSVTPQQGDIKALPAGRRTTQTFQVSVPAGAKAGPADFSVTLSGQVNGRSTSVTRTQHPNVPYASVTAAADTVGVSDNGNPGAGNFDGSGYSYSAQSLAADGVTPGGTVKVGTATTAFPSQAPGTPDAVSSSGQVIKVSGTGKALVVLGAAHNGAARGTLKTTFTDGTSTDVPIDFSDWYSNAPTGLSSIVATGQWNQPPSGGIGQHDVSLYGEVYPLPAGKTLAYVTMPTVGNLNLFSISTDNPGSLPKAPPGQSFASAVNNAAVSDDSNPGVGNFDGAGNSYSAQALAKHDITPGDPVTVEGTRLTFPSQAPGTPDAVSAEGQTLTVDGTGHKITLLTAASNGEVLAFLQVNYTDGTNELVPIDVADWYDNSPAPGGSLVATTTWNQKPGNNTPHDVSLYGLTIDTGASKTVTSITLPKDNRLKVFTAAVHS
ncbi:glycoside hydrolase family 3 C-terminal domain-containing protein [Actinoallomurus sp. NPDC050550]|uniref:glycoside hydrolase family 3 C-terminal domain-containing protein n=1 Tax=Actinoallomurus sp. NPDC050550 TaxID=3154937 RepID=UPI0033BFDF59